MAKLPLTKREQAIPYAKYYYLPLETERPEDAAFLNHPLPEEGVCPMNVRQSFLILMKRACWGAMATILPKRGAGLLLVPLNCRT